MLLRRAIRYVLEMFGLTAVLLVSALAAETWPDFETIIKLNFVFVLLWRIREMWLDWKGDEFSDPLHFRRYVDDRLYSEHRWVVWRVLQVLSLFVGCRFGMPAPWSRRFDRSAELWRRWWETTAAQLDWDPVVKKYLERTYAASKDASPTGP